MELLSCWPIARSRFCVCPRTGSLPRSRESLMPPRPHHSRQPEKEEEGSLFKFNSMSSSPLPPDEPLIFLFLINSLESSDFSFRENVEEASLQVTRTLVHHSMIQRDHISFEDNGCSKIHSVFLKRCAIKLKLFNEFLNMNHCLLRI